MQHYNVMLIIRLVKLSKEACEYLPSHAHTALRSLRLRIKITRNASAALSVNLRASLR